MVLRKSKAAGPGVNQAFCGEVEGVGRVVVPFGCFGGIVLVMLGGFTAVNRGEVNEINLLLLNYVNSTERKTCDERLFVL